MDIAEHTPDIMLKRLFQEVLEFAGQDPDRFLLLRLPGEAPTNGRKAAFYATGPLLYDEPDDIIRGEALALANTAEGRRRHRIAAFSEIEWEDPLQEAILAGLLRHEVRHAEQRDAHGSEFFDIYDLATLACSWKVGGMPRGAVLYGLIPAEMDANAAAAQFLRERRSDLVQAVLESDDGPLARSHTNPGPLADLPIKMVAFLYMLREVVDDPTRAPGGLSFERRLRQISARAADGWAALSSA